VSRAAHEEQLEGLRAEVARLDQESRDRARSIEAMEREREALLAEVEDLRDARESLQADVAARDAKLREMRVGYDALVKDLESDVAAVQLQMEQLTEGLSFRLPQDVLFPPGSAVLEPKGRQAVAEIAARIKDVEGRVEVQGHTDDRAITGALAQRYPTNWELAGARAASVVRVLEESGVASARLSAVSLGSTRPLAGNETREGRAQNRRIEVRVLPTAASPLPGAGAAGEALPEAAPPEAAPAEAGSAPEGLPPGPE
jgi:chemotaxis protein MotB